MFSALSQTAIRQPFTVLNCKRLCLHDVIRPHRSSVSSLLTTTTSDDRPPPTTAMFRMISSTVDKSAGNDAYRETQALQWQLESSPTAASTRKSHTMNNPFRNSNERSFVHGQKKQYSAQSQATRTVTIQRGLSPTSSTALTSEASYPVQAFHAAQTINLAAVISKVFATRGVRKMMERLSVVVRLPADEKGGDPRFIVVFRFGSVVFFNVSPRESSVFLNKIKKHATEPVSVGFEQKENFCVHVQPDFDLQKKVVTGDYCIVQELNMKSVDVISNILAQSVAIDSYSGAVEELLSDFAAINGVVNKTGNLTNIERDKLFRTVAQNNSIFIDMVSKLGLKDRSDTAWNLSQYESINEQMKDEFELSTRFQDIEFKLNLIQQNAKFFLEVLANQKSNSLEWIIIVLIMFECVLMCMEMSGVGNTVFASLAEMAGMQSSTVVAAPDQIDTAHE